MSKFLDLETIAPLLEKAGFGAGDSIVERLPGGANNRVFAVNCDGKQAFLKVYFQHPGDRRDRRTAEFAFAGFAWAHGIRRLPQPLASDAAAGASLFEFVTGHTIGAGEVTDDAICQAIDFFVDINAHRSDPATGRLPRAVEACFSIAEHLNCVERRFERFAGVTTDDPITRDAADFIYGDLRLAWQRISNDTRRCCRELEMDPEAELETDARCLSPSDFGFHNALSADDGMLRFVDFEYAGWDDPAKLVSDFFCQKAVPVPLSRYDRFVQGISAGLSRPEQHLIRMALLLPVYQVKWCCILLNEFLPAGMARRRFAENGEAKSENRAAQIVKATAALAELPGYVDQRQQILSGVN